MLWQRIARLPTVENYRAITDIPGQKNDQSNQRRAIELVEESLATAKNQFQHQTALNGMATLYLHFEQHGRALELAERNKLEPELLIRIARANRDQPGRALPLIFRAAGSEALLGGNDRYRDAIEILQEGRTLGGDEQLERFVDGLRELLTEYKRKRNFCQWARGTFADIL